MELLKFVRLIVVLVTMVSGARIMTKEQNMELAFKNVHPMAMDPQHGQVMCARLSNEPYFGIEMLLGKPWRIYYTWNMDLQNQCLDMTFMNATPAVINRFYNDMSKYLETEPHWDVATVLVRMCRLRHEMLLFADQGSAGSFQGVPNLNSYGGITPTDKLVPLRRFHLKLLYGGKYLLMADCQMAVATLSTRRNKLPYRTEIGGIVSNLNIGPGLHACQSDKNMN